MKSLVFAIALAFGGLGAADAWACDCQKKEAPKACDCAGQSCPGECPGMGQQAPEKSRQARKEKDQRKR